jgi:hypothetical protein
MVEETPAPAATGAQQQSGSETQSTHGASDPVLHRLKELEESNVLNAKHLERIKKELQDKEDKIKVLSADKRKEMEGILGSAIDNWLNSLSGVSDENKTNFRQGISKIAETADMNNAAWEIVCNASALHNNNVKKINELLSQAQDRERELGDLKGFKSEASRISGIKRSRAEDEPQAHTALKKPAVMAEEAGEGNNNTWDMFQGMISRDFRSSYF